jgi:hypothetical protein
VAAAVRHTPRYIAGSVVFIGMTKTRGHVTQQNLICTRFANFDVDDLPRSRLLEEYSRP